MFEIATTNLLHSRVFEVFTANCIAILLLAASGCYTRYHPEFRGTVDPIQPEHTVFHTTYADIERPSDNRGYIAVRPLVPGLAIARLLFIAQNDNAYTSRAVLDWHTGDIEAWYFTKAHSEHIRYDERESFRRRFTMMSAEERHKVPFALPLSGTVDIQRLESKRDYRIIVDLRSPTDIDQPFSMKGRFSVRHQLRSRLIEAIIFAPFVPGMLITRDFP